MEGVASDACVVTKRKQQIGNSENFAIKFPSTRMECFYARYLGKARTLDHLQMRTAELGGQGIHHRHHHGVVRVRMDDGPGAPQIVRRHKQGRAFGELGRAVRRGARARRLEHLAVLVEDEHVFGLHSLLLNAAGSHDDPPVRSANGNATAGAAHPALRVKVSAHLADQRPSLGVMGGWMASDGDRLGCYRKAIIFGAHFHV